MQWQHDIRAALQRHLHPIDDDVVEELAQHATASFQQARADGATPEEATTRVRTLIDGWCAAAPRRRLRQAPAIEPAPPPAGGWIGIGRDLRYGLRQMRRQPGFALTAISLVALGVGAATTLFSLTYSVLLKPLAWPDASRTISIVETREGATRQTPNTFTNATYLAWRDNPSTITAIAAYASRTATVTGSESGERDQRDHEVPGRARGSHQRRALRVPFRPQRIVRRTRPPHGPALRQRRHQRHHEHANRFALDVGYRR